MTPFYAIAKALAFRLDAESVHDRALSGLGVASRSRPLLRVLDRSFGSADPRLHVSLFGRTFPGPLGVAAGLDKNGVAAPALQALGFAFVEVGTITPEPQPGNPKLRVFRLPEDEALINRMGFPGQGVETVTRQLTAHGSRLGIVGCNIGPNKASVAGGRADDDCAAVFTRLRDAAAYVVVNVSSPNTARLRELQGKDAFRVLLSRVLDARPLGCPTPVLVKIAPDLSDAELDDILLVATDVGLDGIVATNTTLARSASLKSAARSETGGLSGAPLRLRALEVVRRIHGTTGGRLPIIAVGGILAGADVLAAIAAGAHLAQTYTGFIYRGPSMARDVQREMLELLVRWGIPTLEAARGDREIAALLHAQTTRG